MIQWLELSTFTAVGPGSILGQGTEIQQAMRCNHIKKNRIWMQDRIMGALETVFGYLVESDKKTLKYIYIFRR